MAKLVREGATEGIEILGAGLVLGRERGCDVILRSNNVSRRHARLTIREDKIWVEDLSSFNGTRINGNRIDRITELHGGDVLVFGDLKYTIVDDQPPPKKLADTHVVNAIFAGDSVSLSVPKEIPVAPVLSSPAPSPQRELAGIAPTPAKVPSGKRTWPQVAAQRPRVHESDSQTPDFLLRSVCVSFFVVSLIIGFGAGKIAEGLGAIKLPGELSAQSNLNLLPPRPVVHAPEPAAVATETSSKAGSVVSSTNGQSTSNAPAESGQNQSVTANANSNPSGVAVSDPLAEKEAAGGEMSDSVKTIRLLREMKQANIDVGDTEAIKKIAEEKLGMSPEQARRIMRLVNSVAERNALLEGRFNDAPKPKRPSVANNSSVGKPSVASQNTTTTNVVSGTNGVSVPVPSTPNDSASASNPISSTSTSVARPEETPNGAFQPQAVAIANVPPPEILVIRRGPGYYLNFWGLLLILGLLFAWLFNLPWLFFDMRELGLVGTLWAPILGAAGPAGATLALLTPDLGWGTMFNSACLSTPLLAYIVFRDERLPTRRRILWFVPSSDAEVAKAVSPLFDSFDVDFFPFRDAKKKAEAVDHQPDYSGPEARLAKSLFAQAVARRASEVRLEFGKEEYIVTLKIDGTMRRADSFRTEIAERLPHFLRSLSGEQASPANPISRGRFRTRVGSEIMDVFTIPEDERLALKLFRRNEDLDNLSGLGCQRKTQGDLREIVTQSKGLFLVCGPAGSGKSTTLRATIGELDASQIRIVSIENPIEYRIDDVTQIELNSRLNQTFGSALQGVWTDDPDVVLIGDVEDQITAAAITGQASQRHKVVASVNARGIAGAIQKLIELGATPSELADRLLGVLSQNLVCRLCPDCKVQYHPDAELLRRSRIPIDHDMIFCRPPQKKSDCEKCEGTGYRGRTGIFELLKVDATIRELIRNGADPSQIRSAARGQKIMTIRESGLRLAIRGVTSLDEVNNVTRG